MKWFDVKNYIFYSCTLKAVVRIFKPRSDVTFWPQKMLDRKIWNLERMKNARVPFYLWLYCLSGTVKMEKLMKIVVVYRTVGLDSRAGTNWIALWWVALSDRWFSLESDVILIKNKNHIVYVLINSCSFLFELFSRLKFIFLIFIFFFKQFQTIKKIIKSYFLKHWSINEKVLGFTIFMLIKFEW